MKKLMTAGAAVFGLGFGGLVLASDGKITITGQVSDKTCTIGQGGGGADKLVPLDPIASSSLPAGTTAGQTPFTLEFSGCNATKVKAFFEPGDNVDPTTGDLKNTLQGVDASNVQIRILNADMEAIDLRNNKNNMTYIDTDGTAGDASATLTFHAAYQAPASAAATKGDVNTFVRYSMNYE